MTVLFTLFTLAAVAMTVGFLALIEVLFNLNRPRTDVPAQPRVAPVAFDLETLRRSVQPELLAQSA
jgi:hypothetical protein